MLNTPDRSIEKLHGFVLLHGLRDAMEGLKLIEIGLCVPHDVRCEGGPPSHVGQHQPHPGIFCDVIMICKNIKKKPNKSFYSSIRWLNSQRITRQILLTFLDVLRHKRYKLVTKNSKYFSFAMSIFQSILKIKRSFLK